MVKKKNNFCIYLLVIIFLLILFGQLYFKKEIMNFTSSPLPSPLPPSLGPGRACLMNVHANGSPEIDESKHPLLWWGGMPDRSNTACMQKCIDNDKCNGWSYMLPAEGEEGSCRLFDKWTSITTRTDGGKWSYAACGKNHTGPLCRTNVIVVRMIINQEHTVNAE